jgi:glycerol uptake facilitator-like aquaporin
MVIVGSGIMGSRLSGGNLAMALLANSLATGIGLAILIAIFGPISGAHFNPLVSVLMIGSEVASWSEIGGRIAVQVVGAFAGVAAAHAMFSESLFSVGMTVRTGWAQWWSEVLATAGLILVIMSCERRRLASAPLLIGGYITAAYWVTSSTSFANPAVTIARAASRTFAGIRPVDVGGFVASQIVGAAVAWKLGSWLLPMASSRSLPIGSMDPGEFGTGATCPS